MDTKDIIYLSVMGLILLINPLVSWLNSRLYKQKSEILQERINHISNLYLPLLIVMKNYYADKEDYENAQNIKDLIKKVVELDESIKTK